MSDASLLAECTGKLCDSLFVPKGLISKSFGRTQRWLAKIRNMLHNVFGE